MSAEKKAKLEAAGWKVGSTADFLGLTPEESAEADVLAMAAIQAQREEETKRKLRTAIPKRKRMSAAA